MPTIKTITAHEILDSRGNPTVEATVVLSNGITASASVPSGASTGSHEALELRDNDKNRYEGKGVLKAVKNINTTIAKHLTEMDVYKQNAIDSAMIKCDGTDNKAKLGANSILAVSLACARAGSLARKEPLYRYMRRTFSLKYKNYRLPTPMCNVINGGRHADNPLAIQECMIVPHAKTFSSQLQIATEVFMSLKKILSKKGFSTLVGDEGGFAPAISDTTTALDLLTQAITQAGYTSGKDVMLAMDVASSEFFEKNKGYNIGLKSPQATYLNYAALATLYHEWVKKYPLVSIEDPFAEDNWNEWSDFTQTTGKKLQIVGDDLFVTNAKRLQRGIDSKAANAILIKLNQIGTLSETIDCIQKAQSAGYRVIISHRSGETVDSFISDLAVAVNADYIKAGSLSRSERVEKYNRLARIEQELKIR